MRIRIKLAAIATAGFLAIAVGGTAADAAEIVVDPA
jgi:hypothetical protein